MRAPTQELLSFSSPLVTAEVLRDANNHRISGRKVIVNMSGTTAQVGGEQASALPPFSSTILIDSTVSGQLLGVFEPHDVVDQEFLARELGWTDFYGPGHDRPILLKSEQQTVGNLTLDKALLLHTPDLGSAEFTLKANLWFSPAGTDCGIHNEHAFVEIHPQISGTGRMQKFTTKDRQALYEDQFLAPGTTNPVPFCTEFDGRFQYPWHQYKAETDCIWLALEYHQF